MTENTFGVDTLFFSNNCIIFHQVNLPCYSLAILLLLDLAHFQYFSVMSRAKMKVLAHKASSLFRIISLRFSEVELLGQRV